MKGVVILPFVPSLVSALLSNNNVNGRLTGYSRASRPTASALDMSIPNSFDTLTSGLASIARISFGVVANPATREKSSESLGVRIKCLYDVESSRECRMVRERITELDLLVERVIPAASNSRSQVELSGVFLEGVEGVVQPGTPCMVVSESTTEDATVEKKLIGSDDILAYLDQSFGSRTGDTGLNSDNIRNKAKDFVDDVGSYLPNILRWRKGEKVANCAVSRYTPRPTKPLILYSYEGNQFCRLVREVLIEIDVVYELRSAGKGSVRRNELAEITGGSTQCPFLIDPNTETQMSESKDIIQYLYDNYANWTPPNEALQLISSLYTPVVKPLFSYLAPLQAGKNDGNIQEYELNIESAMSSVNAEIDSNAVVIYTYELSPFCNEAKELLDRLKISYKEVSLGLEWIPGLIAKGGAEKRAALGELTGLTSLPHIFVAGKSIGGLFSGNPGLIPLLEEGTLLDMVQEAESLV